MFDEYRFAILDDEEIALTAISSKVKAEMHDFNCIGYCDTFSNAEDFWKGFKKNPYDAILLDITMPDCDGIEIAKQIRDTNPSVILIFVSSREDKVFQSFAVHPFGFIRKSRFSQDVHDVLKLLIQSREKDKKDEDSFIIEHHGSLISFVISDTTYVESCKNYQVIHNSKNVEPLQVRVSLGELDEKLHDRGFIRAHKGFLVNYRFIRRIDKTAVIMLDGTEIPISRRKVEEVRDEYLALMRATPETSIL